MSILGLCNRENRPKYLHKGFQYGVLETGLSMIRYKVEYGFDTFLEQGGAASDAAVAAYITSLLAREIQKEEVLFDCSILSVENQDGRYLC